MVCFHPIRAWRDPFGDGRLMFRYNPKLDHGSGLEKLKIPCGRCDGCRAQQAQWWGARCYHESQTHRANSFVTLTYRPESLPEDGSVSVAVHQDFMKRLRKAVGRVRFFMCGEYGEKLQRPHYHYCLFGYDPPDKQFLKRTARGDPLYTSQTLEQVWPHGFVTVGSLTFSSACYTARYVMKKAYGTDQAEHYLAADSTTGEVRQVHPEFVRMSRRPGIGSTWCDRFSSDVFPHDFIVIDGRKIVPPRYYVSRLAESDQAAVKLSRELRSGEANFDDQTDDRLAVREEVQRLRMQALKRSLEVPRDLPSLRHP